MRSRVLPPLGAFVSCVVLLAPGPSAAQEPAAPYLVRDVMAGAVGSQPVDYTGGLAQPGSFAVVGGIAYYAATEPVSGREVWRSDGTASGTYLLRDIAPSPSWTWPRLFTAVGETVFFVGGGQPLGQELWKTDGTSAGTVNVKDIQPGPAGTQIENLVAVGETLFFTACLPATGCEPWKSDGTAAGTTMVKDVNPGPGSSLTMLEAFGVLGDRIIFQADDGATGLELWSSDGTEAGTVLVKDIDPRPLGAASDPTGRSSPQTFTTVGDAVYFWASDETHGRELWKTDGTADGTVLVKDIRPGTPAGTNYPATRMTAAGGALYFQANDPTGGYGLFRSDGTAAGTGLVRPTDPGNSGPGALELVTLDGLAYFKSFGEGGYELWRSDGTAAGTYRVKDIWPGWDSADPTALQVVGHELFFSANDGVSGVELWRSDGTEAGTTRVGDVAPGAASSTPGPAILAGDRVVFSADDGAHGRELWAVDPNRAPAANAGPDQEVPEAQPVTLDGTGSSDPDGQPLTYEWRDGAGALLGEDAVLLLPPQLLGTYTFTLTVSDGALTDSDAVSVNVVEQTPRHLGIALTGTEGGTGFVFANPPGAMCDMGTPGQGAWCEQLYTQGDVVTLVANPYPQSVFVGWSGDCSGTGACQVTMANHRNVVANFLGPRLLGVSVVGFEGGIGLVTIDPPGTSCEMPAPDQQAWCERSYTKGDVVTITPVAGPQSEFAGWLGACNGTGPCQVTMTDHTWVAAYFQLINQPPTVAITSPPAGATPPAPSTILLQAAASDPDGTVTSVEFFANGAFVGQATAAPYQALWSVSTPGPYTLTARVTDNRFATVVSAPVAIVLNASPVVTLTTPADGAVLDAPGNVPLAATASDADGTISRVDFLVDGVLLGSDTTSPYTFVWSNPSVGEHPVVALAWDDRGASGFALARVTVRGHLVATADSYVRDGAPSSNFGTASSLLVRQAPGFGNNYWTYLKFDTSSIPLGASRYVLRLYGNDPGGTVATEAFAVATTSWTESGLTWNNRPATGATALAGTLVTSTTQWYEWDVTDYVTAEKAAGRNVVAIALKNPVPSGNQVQFRSRQQSSNRPELLVVP